MSRLVGEAVAEFRGQPAEAEAVDVKVDLPVDANLPVDYLPGERLRLGGVSLAGRRCHRRGASTRCEPNWSIGTGRYRQPVENLLAVARFKVLARRYGVTEISLQGGSIRFSPVTLPESAQLRLRRLYDRSLYKQAVSTLVGAATQRAVALPDTTLATTAIGGEPLRDIPLLNWCAEVLAQVLPPPA